MHYAVYNEGFKRLQLIFNILSMNHYFVYISISIRLHKHIKHSAFMNDNTLCIGDRMDKNLDFIKSGYTRFLAITDM